MTYTLQQLSDFEDIRTLKHRYFRCIDTADIKELAELLTEDFSVDYRGGDYRVKISGRSDFLEFQANSFSTDAVAMHQGHIPEIRLTGEDTAEGSWYLEDIFISLSARRRTVGSALYKDKYRRVGSEWKIEFSEYDRIIELVDPLPANVEITSHYLAKFGRKAADVTDMSHVLVWADGRKAE